MKHPRTILHLTSHLDGYGRSAMLRSLSASQTTAGDRAIVAALTADKLPAHDLRAQGVAVQRLGSHWPVDVIALARLARLRRQVVADVTHAWDVKTLAQAAMSGRRRRGQILIGSLSAIGEATSWTTRILRAIQKRVTAFTVADEPARMRLAELGVDHRCIHVIRPGVPRGGSGDHLPARRRLLDIMQLPEEATLIAVAGPLLRRQQVDEAIWAFELVRVVYPAARMLIVGDGPDRGRLERFAEQTSEPACVQFLGYRDDWRALLPGVDFYWQLNPSVTTPLGLLEAGAAGRPIVASDVPAHRAAVAPERTGMLVKLADRAEAVRATDEMLANPARADRMGQAAAERVAESWSIDATLSAFDRLYDKLLQTVLP